MSYWLPDRALLAECREEASRSSGPGGQHVNKTSSAVRLVHLPTGEAVQCQDHRERLRNRADAVAALRLRLALTVRGVADPVWMDEVRRGRQITIGPRATAYPRIIGCLLDALVVAEGRLAEAAQALGVSSSQVARLLTADKAVHQTANALRAGHGLGPVLAR